jgi:hypothetical protein
MTGDDLKRLQDNFLATSKKILLADGNLRPVAFIVTLAKHIDKLRESSWGVEFIGPQPMCVRDDQDDRIATLILPLVMSWKSLYHAILDVFPTTRDIMPGMITLGESVPGVEDPYETVVQAFLRATNMKQKDVAAAVIREICGKVDAFACILHSEAWYRTVAPTESVDQIYKDAPKSLGQDTKSVEVIVSTMETYNFARMLTMPIERELSPEPSDRGGGKILGFGTMVEHLDSPDGDYVLRGRMARFLKPLPEAS